MSPTPESLARAEAWLRSLSSYEPYVQGNLQALAAEFDAHAAATLRAMAELALRDDMLVEGLASARNLADECSSVRAWIRAAADRAALEANDA